MTKDLRLFSAMMVAFLLMVMILTAIFTVRYEHFDEQTNGTKVATITFDEDNFVWQVDQHIRR